MHIGLLPLDERPVNLRYPAQIAATAGATLVLPPRALLPRLRTPGDVAALADWLQDTAPSLDALIVDLEMLTSGGLIAARITDETPGQLVARLDLLREIRRDNPQLKLTAFSVITRVSNADYNLEEPVYWEQYGTALYRLSQLLDRAQQGQAVAAALAAAQAAVPAAHRADFLRRRLRNHTLNLAALHLLHDDVLDLLVISSDDTSPYGLGSREKRWLASWDAVLGAPARGELLMYPGADEVGCALLIRAINKLHGRTPAFAVEYAPAAGAEIIAPYEDGPARTTVERQILACGGVLDGDNADLFVAVNAPSPRRTEWQPAFADDERTARTPELAALVARVAAQVHQRPVVVADIAYPNGADPVLVALLAAQLPLAQLAAYGAWNTAGNTVGTALAQGNAWLYATTAAQRQAAEYALVHHLVEDWGYQHLARSSARDWLEQTHGISDPTTAHLAATSALIAQHLAAHLASLPDLGARWQLVPGSTYQPWGRLFEVDFDLEKRS